MGTTHRGKHWTLLPKDYVAWACGTVKGFKEEFEALRSTELPLPVEAPIKGRKWDWPNPLRHYDDRLDRNPKPKDDGDDVTDSAGSVIGRRGYTKFNSDEWVAKTIYPDESANIHCGGPCGDLYVDEFGNT